MRKIIVLVLVVLVAGSLVGFFGAQLTGATVIKRDYQGHISEAKHHVYAAIEAGEKTGEYECCYEPGCDMCILGNFIWDNGECHCDDLIAEGKPPCPQCDNHGCDDEVKDYCEADHG